VQMKNTRGSFFPPAFRQRQARARAKKANESNDRVTRDAAVENIDEFQGA